MPKTARRRAEILEAAGHPTAAESLAESAARERRTAGHLKTELLADVSHELLTPVNTIIGFSELLSEEMDGPLTAFQKRMVSHIRRGALHMLALINDLLDLNKVETGRIELRREVFDISAAIKEVLSSIRVQAKPIRIVTRIAGPAAVDADYLRFKQILYNLLNHAVKCTPPGGKIGVTAIARKGVIEFSVRDAGSGIPKEQQESIFERFHQVSASPSESPDSTGFGLAIARALVEQHGGRIWLKSEPAKGSCFTFTLPRGAAATRTTAPETKRPAVYRPLKRRRKSASSGQALPWRR